MKTLSALAPAQLALAEARLLHPLPGRPVEAARKHGIDLTLLTEQLRLTPAQRAEKPERAATAPGKVRSAAHRRSGGW